jgi:hypothetical protein
VQQTTTSTMSPGQSVEDPTHTTRPDDTSKRKPQKGNERKYFQQMQPTFAVTLPRRTTRIEFLDESNPAKDTIIRRKAREWVNQNRDQTRKGRRKQRRAETETEGREATPTEDIDTQVLQTLKNDDTILTISPRQTVGSCQYDPFCSLPVVDANYEHLLDYCKFRSSRIYVCRISRFCAYQPFPFHRASLRLQVGLMVNVVQQG